MRFFVRLTPLVPRALQGRSAVLKGHMEQNRPAGELKDGKPTLALRACAMRCGIGLGTVDSC